MMDDTFGPLAGLTGTWSGDKGMDIAPEPDGTESNPYFETIVYSDIGDVTNAEEQKLWFVHYHQIVSRKSNGKVFHNETGYWMWDPAAEVIMHSLTIPRAVSVLAGGGITMDGDTVTMEVAARLGDEEWGIIQSPFMAAKASTREFRQTFRLGPDTLSYSQTTIVDIYGKVFDHTDQNTLTRT